jgi:hypothetical protein
MKKALIITPIVLIFGIVIFFMVCNYTYSDGKRAGLLVKFSKKGFVLKTYEGDLNLGGVNPIPGNTIANNVWHFSVNDEAVAEALMNLEGKNVRLHYKEKLKVMPWQGETPYLVDKVEMFDK